MHNPHKKGMPSSIEVSEARFKRFIRDFEAYERKLTFERTLDAFLDLYSLWKKTRDRVLKLRVVMLAFELNRLDRGFECELDFTEIPCGKSKSET